LTELRLYTTAFMGWLALVFVWFAATVLRGARARFAYGALVAAVLILGALHVINPDATIVRANAAHARQGRAFDAAYATTLSADAVPALVAALPHLSPGARQHAAQELLARWSAWAGADWRAWSMARSDAWRAVAAQEAALREWAGLAAPQPQAPATAGTLAPETLAPTVNVRSTALPTGLLPTELPPRPQSAQGATPGRRARAQR
jgi:Domain of unknown function (DUF4153)